ncbi:hypothetical protein TIFTF001_028395 [Ficus carica]|uniref:Uncharacterized protein n=1 Tax=Ficus carica TaxID=3494 RepID=A0AA88DPS9_FICCA|nr:hypothetical protein TIFTF001_028395 [Ficus carica]
MSGRSEVPLGVPAASPHSLPSGGSSSGTWGPRIADKDMDWVIRELYPQRGLRIEESMADREQRGTKRPSEADRVARLKKMTKTSDRGRGKGKVGTSTAPPPSQVVTPSTSSSGHQTTESSARRATTHKALVSKFGERLSLDVAESSKRPDSVEAFRDCADKLIEGLCLAFSGSATARGYVNKMEEALNSAKGDARVAWYKAKEAKKAEDKAMDAKKKAEDQATSVEQRAKDAETRATNAEATRNKAESYRSIGRWQS